MKKQIIFGQPSIGKEEINYITKVVNTMRRIYKDMWMQYERDGKIPSKYQNSKYF